MGKPFWFVVVPLNLLVALSASFASVCLGREVLDGGASLQSLASLVHYSFLTASLITIPFLATSAYPKTRQRAYRLQQLSMASLLMICGWFGFAAAVAGGGFCGTPRAVAESLCWIHLNGAFACACGVSVLHGKAKDDS